MKKNLKLNLKLKLHFFIYDDAGSLNLGGGKYLGVRWTSVLYLKNILSK